MRALESAKPFLSFVHPQSSAVAQFAPEARQNSEDRTVTEIFSAESAEIVYDPRAAIQFGTFYVVPTQFLLLEGDRPVAIGSRALEILIVLLERPGELVSKQELMARIWPNLFVEPANLSVHISALRRVLRDGQNLNRFIINIPGRGYSFVAPVALTSRDELGRVNNKSALREPRDYSAVA